MDLIFFVVFLKSQMLAQRIIYTKILPTRSPKTPPTLAKLLTRHFSKPKTVARVGQILLQPTKVMKPLKSTLYFLLHRAPRRLAGRNIHVGTNKPRRSLRLSKRSEFGHRVVAFKGGCSGGGSPLEISGPHKMILKLEILMILL